jgi:hypothetical protein
MPLSFETTSHGAVAFGFFNIDVDLLLLDRALFFADGFARAIEELAAAEGGAAAVSHIDGFRAADPGRLGNTMGAIHGFDRRGLIGEVYEHFPFPARPEDFLQDPDGSVNRSAIEPMLARWTAPQRHSVVVDVGQRRVEIAGLTFDWPWFQELVAYVWRGGYPRWRDERRPEYLVPMREAVEGAGNPLFAGQEWELRRVRT